MDVLAAIADVAIMLTVVAWVAVGVTLWAADRIRSGDGVDAELGADGARAQVRRVFVTGLGVLLLLELLLTPFDVWAVVLLVPTALAAAYSWTVEDAPPVVPSTATPTETADTDTPAWTSKV